MPKLASKNGQSRSEGSKGIRPLIRYRTKVNDGTNEAEGKAMQTMGQAKPVRLGPSFSFVPLWSGCTEYQHK